MEILLIILLAPLALALGFGILRLLFNPLVWLIPLCILGLIAPFLR